ncbi:amidase family protein [Streptomyces sp. DSM 3412]|uniref:Amidase family protein n=1 Tax=Streptomyces gottesmaniae TaxID=3075518 RepID=A0ABU2Z109_9ACTN|nr:amidase family protein [Streptomyces sp. DSM 3412]MDT0570266.1 amidase family protein [Streptomyces sp. DSM 3412]
MGFLAHAGRVLRRPAACCAVVGLRPTAGLVPEWSGVPRMKFPLGLQYMAMEGPLGRTVSDVRLAPEAMSTPELRSPADMPALPSRSVAAPGRVAVLRGIGSDPTLLPQSGRWATRWQS